MILVADSGSTKCDWRLISNEADLPTETIGLNPYFVNEHDIELALQKNELFKKNADHVKKVFFYGAGCSSTSMNSIVKDGLKRIFSTSEIHVDHDVLGAALAAGQGEECIACILGTGSNACYYDGENISQKTPSLAYILGDEGSGSWFGKQLLRDFLYGDDMPEKLRQHLVQKGINKEVVLEEVYRKDHPNVYLASFTKDIGLFRETEYVHQMLFEGVTAFLERHVCCYPNFQNVQVNFVGSVAHHFRNELHEAASALGISVGNVIQKPIDGMVEFHCSRMY